jgi:flavin reductase (DIM6/NTAB) family NADH-FMN oxidoreductase RutF
VADFKAIYGIIGKPSEGAAKTMSETHTVDQVAQALKRMPYGFYALGSKHGDDANLMVLNWVTQASFEPQLLAVALQKTSYSYGLVEKSKKFVLNLFLSADQDLVRPYTKGRAKNPDKMKDAKITFAPQTGAPILDGAAAYLECEVVNKLETGGDHDVFLAKVIGGAVLKPGEAQDSLRLVDLGWSYAG